MKKKTVRAKPVKWTEAEDFFIRENIMKYNDIELAKVLNKTEKQVITHIKDLGIDVDALLREKKHQQALKGLQIGSANDSNQNIVAMTGARSMADDLSLKTKKNESAFKITELEKQIEEIKEADKKAVSEKANKMYDKFKVPK